MFDFSNKVVVVTGGSGGIGGAVVRMFAANNATVVLVYRSNTESASRIANECESLSGKVILKQGSVADADFVKTMFYDINKQFGHIDMLINNAGINKDGFLMTSKVADIQKVVDTNLMGVILCSKLVTPYMIQKKCGKIINTASVSALKGTSGHSIYSAAKAGVIGLTKSLAVELARFNIEVNAVAPGFIKTKMTDKLPTAIRENYMSMIPMKKFGESTDVANLIEWLCSDLCNYITGQTIVIDGGLSC